MKQFKMLALAGAVSALLLGAGSANAHVTYNLGGNCNGACPTDGDVAAWSDGDPGYTGNLPATWVAMVHNLGGSANSQTASSADAIAGGIANGIKVGARAYKDNATNWGHNADFGLFELEHDATVTITVSSDNSSLRSAFGLWGGWATGGSRHGAFTSNGAINTMAASPLGSGLSLIDTSAWAVAASQGTPSTPTTATLTRFLTAGNYTLIIGGYDGSVAGHHAYTATISAAPVPIPAAAWLFGSALSGLGVIGRRKGKPAA